MKCLHKLEITELCARDFTAAFITTHLCNLSGSATNNLKHKVVGEESSICTDVHQLLITFIKDTANQWLSDDVFRLAENVSSAISGGEFLIILCGTCRLLILEHS